jgi:hypothetical protein
MSTPNISPTISKFKSVAVVQGPFGPVNLTTANHGLDSTIATPFGTFSGNQIKAALAGTPTGNPKTPVKTNNPGHEGATPELAATPLNPNYQGQLTKVTLMSKDFPKGVVKSFSLQFNPETLEFGYPNSFGEYGGVLRVPTLYYSGQKVDRINVRFIVVDRVNGCEKWFNQLLQFATPNGTPQSGTATTTQFTAPPLTFMAFGKTGTFKGYVENPRMEVTLWDRDLKPLIAYLSFTFLSIKRQTISSVVGSQ